MKFIAFGLNHETAPLDTSEAFSLGNEACADLLSQARAVISSGLVVLSTCNRTECYLYGTEADAAYLREQLAKRAESTWPHDQSFEYFDEDAVEHILQVTSGARSLVPGDGQILSQMKEAYELAVDAQLVGMVMHRLMHTAFRAAKRVSRETDLASGAASVSSAAIALADAHFEKQGENGLEGKHLLLVGAGEMSKLALQAALRHQPSKITITNRSPERAEEIAEVWGGITAPWSDRMQLIGEADCVLVATGAPEPIITAKQLSSTSPQGNPALIIDIARPRNVAADVGALEAFTVRDMEDLQDWIDRVEEERRSELPSAQEICRELLGEFVSWVFHQEALQPAIDSIRSTFEHIRLQEIERHAHRFSEADQEELHQITQSILQKLLAVPIVRLKSVDPDSMDFVRGIKLLSILFEREDEASAPTDAKQGCPFDEREQSSSKQLDIQELRRILSVIDHDEAGQS